MATLKQLSRIQSDDNSLNRLQDQLASALNPILRNVKGDLSGPLESPTVAGLQGNKVSPIDPVTGQALVWDGKQWLPQNVGGGTVTLAGDVTGPSGANTVERIQGYDISPTAPMTNEALVWDGTAWTPTAITSGGGSPAMPAAWGTEYLWWKLDESIDLSIPAYAANSGSAGASGDIVTPAPTPPGGPTMGLPSPVGYGFRFRSDFGLKGANGVAPSVTTAVTASLWINDAITIQSNYLFLGKTLIVPGSGDIYWNLYIYLQSGQLKFSIITLGSGAVFATAPSGLIGSAGPHLLSLTYDGTKLRGYVDGVEVASATATGAIDWYTSMPGYWYVGQDYTNNGVFFGQAYDARVATEARTGPQLYADWLTGRGYGGGGGGGGGGSPSGPASGDLAGTYPGPTVDGIQTVPVSSSAPTSGDSLVYSGTQWTPGAALKSPIAIERLSTATAQTITATTDQLTPTTTLHRFQCNSTNYILNVSQPSVVWAGAVAGQQLVLQNVGVPGAGSLVLTRATATTLKLNAATRQIDEGGSITLIYDGTNWVEYTYLASTST